MHCVSHGTELNRVESSLEFHLIQFSLHVTHDSITTAKQQNCMKVSGGMEKPNIEQTYHSLAHTSTCIYYSSVLNIITMEFRELMSEGETEREREGVVVMCDR